MGLILTPDDPEFYPILHSALPPNWKQEVQGDVAYFGESNGGIFALQSNPEEYLEEHGSGLESGFWIENEESDN
jgi:hypothetical protein